MKLKGIYAPIVTPFNADESINYPVLEQLIEYLIANKIAGLVPGGTTGEVYAFIEAERLDIFKFTKEKVNGRVTLIAGTNSGATRDVVRYSQTAEGMGYDALMVAVPPYSRPDQRELLAHYSSVAEAVKIPSVLYNFPWHAGIEVSYEVMDGLTKYDHIIGIKEAIGDMSRVYEFRLQFTADSRAVHFQYLRNLALRVFHFLRNLVSLSLGKLSVGSHRCSFDLAV